MNSVELTRPPRQKHARERRLPQGEGLHSASAVPSYHHKEEKMNNSYIPPELQMITLSAEDVISNSAENNDDGSISAGGSGIQLPFFPV